MNANRFSFSRFNTITTSLLAVLTVAVTTIPLFIIGRNTLGEAVIALLYLVPVAWSANRWGQLPGLSAALAAALAMRASLVEYNSHRVKTGYRAISIGIGLHTGQSVTLEFLPRREFGIAFVFNGSHAPLARFVRYSMR